MQFVQVAFTRPSRWEISDPGTGSVCQLADSTCKALKHRMHSVIATLARDQAFAGPRRAESWLALEGACGPATGTKDGGAQLEGSMSDFSRGRGRGTSAPARRSLVWVNSANQVQRGLERDDAPPIHCSPASLSRLLTFPMPACAREPTGMQAPVARASCPSRRGISRRPSSLRLAPALDL